MKIRLDFVTNSSSSSFVAVSNYEVPDLSEIRRLIKDDKLILGLRGNVIFGRQLTINDDFYSKLNYLALLSLQLNNAESTMLHQLLDYIIEDDFGVKLIWSDLSLLHESGDAYIDHQSLSRGLTIITADSSSIRRFLYNDSSVIITSSDESVNAFYNLDRYFLSRLDDYEVDDVDVSPYDDFCYYYFIFKSDCQNDEQFRVDFISYVKDDCKAKANELFKLLNPKMLTSFDKYELFEDIKAVSTVDACILNDPTLTFTKYINELRLNALSVIESLSDSNLFVSQFYDIVENNVDECNARFDEICNSLKASNFKVIRF